MTENKKNGDHPGSAYPRAIVAPPSGQAFPYKHLVGIWDMDPTAIRYLLDKAEAYHHLLKTGQKPPSFLKGLTQLNLFFEPSTRTQISFEMAGKQLGAHVVNFSASSSALKKGESLYDTTATLNAMAPDIVVTRHSDSGSAAFIANSMDCPLINAGDGMNEHPTQALIDAMTIQNRLGHIHGKTITIVGDLLHSRVARSNIYLLSALGGRIRLAGPPALVPTEMAQLGADIFHTLDEALDGTDIIMALRVQKERMKETEYRSLDAYAENWGITRDRLNLANTNAFVMHPGPVNRDIEITSDIIDDTSSCSILEQVSFARPVRMAVLDILTQPQREKSVCP